jgi:deoxyribose-phosphate aldolase
MEAIIMAEISVKDILSKTDHTLLLQTATWEDIKAICDDGIKYGTASVCIPPSFVKKAAKYSEGRVKICTVIGFPNGYNTTAVKCFETEKAVEDGADEIDMVINLGMVKEKKYGEVLCEINAIKKACKGKLLKVIIETCLLTEEEKIMMSKIVSMSRADYIKTSTGFSTGGATREDVELFAKYTSNDTKIKAAGGIASLDDARDFIRLGADRLGTSRIVKTVKQTEENENGEISDTSY